MQPITTRKIAHNTIVQIIGKIISTALGLLALGMMTRYLGQEKFGWYITAISFLQFAGIIIDFGLIPVTAQMLSEPNADKTKLIQNLFGFRLLTATVCFVLAPGIALFFPYPPEVKAAIALSAISFIDESFLI
jgi:O-antigen/teichoic acid export membrane protein